VNSGPVVAGTDRRRRRAVEFAGHRRHGQHRGAVEGATRARRTTPCSWTDATPPCAGRSTGGFAERGSVTLRGRSEPVTLAAAMAAARRTRWPAAALELGQANRVSHAHDARAGATSHHTPKRRRACAQPARARRIGRSPWPSSGSAHRHHAALGGGTADAQRGGADGELAPGPASPPPRRRSHLDGDRHAEAARSRRQGAVEASDDRRQRSRRT
jgi:hypothetical protein